MRPIVFDPKGVQRWRFDTIMTKEPATIQWLDAIPEGSCLYDVGANVGIYSLYAAAKGHRVVAIEPVQEFCMSLERSLEASGFTNLVTIVRHKVGSLDTLNGPEPTHIKIDTDGDDLGYILKSPETMRKIKSIIVENNVKRTDREVMFELLTEAGLEFRGRHNSAVAPFSKVGMDHWYRP